MSLNEADTRAKLITPAIYKRGWTEDLIRREETAGSIEVIGGKARRRSRGRIDYVLRVKVNIATQSVVLALIEVKKGSLLPGPCQRDSNLTRNAPFCHRYTERSLPGEGKALTYSPIAKRHLSVPIRLEPKTTL